MSKKDPVLIGIILDVSRSMKNNWKNRTGKSLPRFDVVREILNEQIWKLSSLPKIEEKDIEFFCLGMGFQKKTTYVKVDLQRGEKEATEAPLVMYESNLVCDLLALSELIPTESTRDTLEKSLNDKWNLYADSMLRKIRQQTAENARQLLSNFIREGVDKSARRHLYGSWRYLLLKRLEKLTLTRKWTLLNQMSRNLSSYTDTWETKIEIACLAESNKFIDKIHSEVQQLFETKKVEYAEVIKEMLQDFASRQIQIILELLTAGHTAQRTLDYFDEETALSKAKEIFGHLHHEVEERLRAPIIKDLGKFLRGLRFELHASIDRDNLTVLTEKYILKYAWDVLEPFVQETVFNIIRDSFSEISK